MRMQYMRRFRRRWQLVHLLQIHHVIPRQWRGHPALCEFDMDDPSNLVFMPTHTGAQVLRLRPGRLVHDGGHPAYNAFVRSRLDRLEHASDVYALTTELRTRLRATHSDLPWT